MTQEKQTGIRPYIEKVITQVQASGRLESVTVSDVRTLNYYKVYTEPPTPRITVTAGKNRCEIFCSPKENVILFTSPAMRRNLRHFAHGVLLGEGEVLPDDLILGAIDTGDRFIPCVLTEAQDPFRQHPYFVREILLEAGDQEGVNAAISLFEDISSVLDRGDISINGTQIGGKEEIVFRG